MKTKRNCCFICSSFRNKKLLPKSAKLTDRMSCAEGYFDEVYDIGKALNQICSSFDKRTGPPEVIYK